ncbi:ZNF589 isoform 6 [Pongo abelii]|uniref:ZNF589 isoform 6 n=1 Tax=Pongo abelii TaxID=9601 RepID=A0A2J8TFV3_PONAB|nr:ZNF589 isoform 6 [Pongo abelii]
MWAPREQLLGWATEALPAKDSAWPWEEKPRYLVPMADGALARGVRRIWTLLGSRCDTAFNYSCLSFLDLHHVPEPASWKLRSAGHCWAC